MTAIIAFFFFFVVPIPQQGQQPNAGAGGACGTAVAHYRASAAQFNAETATKFIQLFGRPISAPELPRECPQVMKFYHWRLQRARALLSAYNATQAKCTAVGVTIYKRPAVAPYYSSQSYSPAELIGVIQQKIAEGCH